jgi:hypothetical protein
MRCVDLAAHFGVQKGASSGLAMGIGSFLFAGITIVVSTLYVGPKIMQSSLISAVSKQGLGVEIGWITLGANIIGYIMAGLLIAGLLLWALASVGRKIAPVSADEPILKVTFRGAFSRLLIRYWLGASLQSRVSAIPSVEFVSLPATASGFGTSRKPRTARVGA